MRSAGLSILLCSLVGVAAAGCREKPPAGFDAGPRRDAGPPLDGGSDAGFDDAGSDGGTDAAAPSDAGTPPDGGTTMPDAGPPPCPTADLGSMTGLAVVRGTLDLAGNQFMPSCAEIRNGEDLVYLWTAPSAGDWLFDTLGSEFDSVLAIHSGPACPGTEIACNDDADEAVQSAVRVTLAAGEQVLVVVDEFGVLERGSFELNIHAGVPTSEAVCDDGVDEDRDGQADCGDRDCAGAPGC